MSGPKELRLPETAEDGHTGISRRRFLGGLLGVAGAVLGGLGSPRSAKAGPDTAVAGVVGYPPSEQEPRIAAQEYLERTWGFRLTSLDKTEPALAAAHPEVPRVWEEPAIIILDQSLTQLHGGFAPRPASGVEPIEVILGNQPNVNVLNSDERSGVEVDFRVMNEEGRKVAFVDLAGLLVLRQMPLRAATESFHKYPMPMESEWLDKIIAILGGEPHSAPELLKNTANDRGPDKRFYPGEPDLTTGQRGNLSTRLDYAINTLYPLNLVPFLVRESLYGAEEFKKGLSRYIPGDKVAQLYDFVREDIWKGNDYKAFPIK